MVSLEEHAKNLDFRGLMITSIIAGLSFVVGLFWRDAVNETINSLLPEGEGLLFSYVTAFLATVIVIVIAFALVKSQEIKIRGIVMEKKKRKRKKSPGKTAEKKARNRK